MCSNCLLIIFTFVFMHVCMHFTWNSMFLYVFWEGEMFTFLIRLVHIYHTNKTFWNPSYTLLYPVATSTVQIPLNLRIRDYMKAMQSWARWNTPTKILFGTFVRQNNVIFASVCLHLNRTNITSVLDLNYICLHLSWVQMHHYPIGTTDKRHICPSTKHRKIWQKMCSLIYIWPTFVLR